MMFLEEVNMIGVFYFALVVVGIITCFSILSKITA